MLSILDPDCIMYDSSLVSVFKYLNLCESGDWSCPFGTENAFRIMIIVIMHIIRIPSMYCAIVLYYGTSITIA